MHGFGKQGTRASDDGGERFAYGDQDLASERLRDGKTPIARLRPGAKSSMKAIEGAHESTIWLGLTLDCFFPTVPYRLRRCDDATDLPAQSLGPRPCFRIAGIADRLGRGPV